MSRIELRNITVKEKNKILLDDVSLVIEEGEYIGLLGPTGSGPSYVLKVIAGLLPVSSGQVIIDEIDMTNIPPEDRHVGFIFEQFNLFPHLNVLDNLLFAPRMRRENIEIKTKVAREIIQLVKLDGREAAMPRELSGGMQQRVGIARAVTAGAKILLLDQPYRALDAKIRGEMRYEIREIVKELGLTAIHSTHETEEAMITSDKIAIFNNQKLEQVGTPEEVFINPKTIFVATFLAESNLWDCTTENGFAIVQGIKFKISTKINGKGALVVRQQSCRLFKDRPTGENIFHGEIIKIRILGEFIRFVIRLDDGLTLTSREMINVRWEHPRDLVNENIFVEIDPKDIKIFYD